MAETAFKFPDEEVVNNRETADTEIEIEIASDAPEDERHHTKEAMKEPPNEATEEELSGKRL